MRLSIIVPVLNEEQNIPILYQRLQEVASGMDSVDVEVVIVDDGSTDGSVDVARNLPCGSTPVVRIVRLSRNFGSHAALLAGIAHSTGDVLTFLSADLQDPPELIVTMLEKWRDGHDVVFATRTTRDDPRMVQLFSRTYYKLIRRFALPQMPPGGTDFCLVDRKVIEKLDYVRERNSNLFCLLMWAGFRQCTVTYDRQARHAGKSKWTLSKQIKLFIDSFAAFSFFPIRVSSALGIILSMLGALYAAFVAITAIFMGSPIEGWSSLMVVVLLCSGVQLLMLGIISEYLWRVFDVTRDRPSYIVWEVSTVGTPEETPRSRQPGS